MLTTTNANNVPVFDSSAISSTENKPDTTATNSPVTMVMMWGVRRRWMHGAQSLRQQAIARHHEQNACLRVHHHQDHGR